MSMGTDSMSRALLIAAVCLGIFQLAAVQKASAQVVADDVQCNGCVGKTDIGAKQVTSKNIKPGGVTTKNIRRNAVTSAKMSDGAITSDKIDEAAVTSAKIGDGAVTGSKLAPDAVFTRTRIVSPFGDGSDAEANGLELLDALSDVAGATPAPSATNPWLIKIEPGIYDVGSTPVAMLPFVDIEGSGQKTTRIVGSLDGIDNGVVTMASDTELRHVTVVNSGGGGALQSTGVSVDGTDILITHVTAIGFDSTGTTRGIRLDKNCDDATLTNVTAIAQTSVGGGTRGAQLDCDGTTFVSNMIATGTGGTFNQGLFVGALGGIVEVRNAILTGATASVQRSAGTAVLVSSQLDGPVTASANTICIGSYDGTFNPLGTDCQ